MQLSKRHELLMRPEGNKLSIIPLALLGSHPDLPIYSKTGFILEIFLLNDIINKEKAPLDEIEALIYNFKYDRRLILRHGLVNRNNAHYVLTPAGREIAEQVFGEFTLQDQTAIRDHRVSYDQLGKYGLINYVAEYYPELGFKRRRNPYGDV